MTLSDEDQRNGWLEWRGQETFPPQLRPNQALELRIRDGQQSQVLSGFGYRWTHDGGPRDIVAFRLVDDYTPAPPPVHPPAPVLVPPPTPPSEGIGNLASEDKGTGARYNRGKVPYELVPLTMMADYFGSLTALDPNPQPDPIEALLRIGAYQARRVHCDELLYAASALGSEGWEECAAVFDYGRGKYKEWNWAKGMPWSAPIASAARHLLAMIGGEDIDPESGLPHRGHVFCNLVMLWTYAATYEEGDDRAPVGRLA